jgi:phenylalanyl-tRNA synthetase beta chain
MRVSYRWLCELLPRLEASADAVAHKLDVSGFAVDRVEHLGAGLADVLIAEVVKAEPHPRRPNLSLVTVQSGSSEQLVVCGAPNVPPPGGLVVLARPGSVLPALGGALEAREIGGVLSAGMLCSEAELGLSDDATGILVFEPGSARPGTPLPELEPGVTDVIIELDVTPNRGDALGHVGVAREVAALFDVPFAPPEPGTPRKTAKVELSSLVRVQNEDPQRCPHYGAAVVLDVTIGPSPAWLRWRLSALGIRAISNVVDITNLLLLEAGQPLHAFDLDRVRGQEIIVRRARDGEPFTTLDGVAHTLDADDLVICDAEGPSALAGVMGGLDSEIKSSTRRVLLECAYFTPQGVRRTSRRHGLHTESSHRFERGVDWAAVPRVLERAKALLTDLAGGTAVEGAIHATGAPRKLPTITLRSRRLDALLGAPVPFDEAMAALRRLGLSVLERSDDAEHGTSALVEGASWRPDIEREVDLIEEVARMRGLDALPTVLPPIRPQPPRPAGKLERAVARESVALGLLEALSYAFVSPGDLRALHAPEPSVILQNPLSEERSVMTTSLLPGLLDALRRARRRGEQSVRMFSVGPRFLQPPKSELGAEARRARPALAGDAERLPEERPSYAAVLAGPRPEYLTLKPGEVDVYDAKALAVELVERLTGLRPNVARAERAHLHPRGSGSISIGNRELGCFGPLHPDVVDALDLDGSAQIVELDLGALEQIEKPTPRYQPIPKLPPVARDLSLVVREQVLAGELGGVLADAAGELCESVELVSVFSGGSVPEGHRSLTYHLVFRDPLASRDPDRARTLTDQEVDERQAAAVRSARERYGAELRG